MALSTKDEMWLQRVITEETARLQQIQRAWDAYYGINQEVLKPPTSPDNVVINFAQLVVDKSAFFLFGEDLKFDLDPDDQNRSSAETWLDDCLAANRKGQFFNKLAVNGGVSGHVYVKFMPPLPGEKYPRLINLSPEYVHVVTDPDDIDRALRYVIQYSAIDPDTGRELIKRQMIERAGLRWRVLDQISRNGGMFETVTDSLWPYDFCPIVDCQNLPVPNEYYGKSDIEEHVIKLQRAVNFTMSNLQRIIKFHGHPKTWGAGFQAQDLKIAVDQTIVLPNPNAKLQNLEMLSDLSSSIEYYARIKEAIHEVSATPEVATGKLNATGQLSGVALQILYGPLIEKTKVKRLTYGGMIVDILKNLLVMGGFTAEEPTLHWPDALPKDLLQERQALLIDSQLGVSQDTIQAKLGYDPEKEAEKKEKEVESLGEAMLREFDGGGSNGGADYGRRGGSQSRDARR